MAPMETHYDPERRIRRHVVTGPLDVDELIAALTAVYESDDVPLHANVLWDITAADVRLATSDDVRCLADFGRKAWQENPGYRMAFLVASDLSFGMIRMFEQMLGVFDEYSARVFRSREDAEAWITDTGTDRSAT